MKVLLCLSALVAVSYAMPRYLVIPLEDLEYLPQGRIPVVYQPGLARQARQVEDGFEPNQYDEPAQAGSSAYAAPHAGGADHVDYGAYTGGYGAFGWYTDHPVLLGAHH
eukprot:TRINITY_DN15989_c0_g1_i1.p1 TRINITY_DN15989_c0_g1~~TRINITY_DN15989_c0_g1_i1.p1  ORF type:complete len:116 (-),score=20.91 TRINITY_DN15989_c0_g1_i1:357-683(-)